MRAWLKQQFLGSDWGFRILFPWVRTRNYFLEGGWRSDRVAIERTFLGTFGYRLDWDRPRTLNEKLNWMKLNVRDPRQRIAADKYAVREFVRERAGEDCLIPLLRVYDRAEDIRFAELPRSFVLKVNHGSGQNWIVRDQNQEDERRVVRQFREWMATSHYTISREWPYKDMRPRIVVEELLVDEGGGFPATTSCIASAGRPSLFKWISTAKPTTGATSTTSIGISCPFSGPSGRETAPAGPTAAPFPGPNASPR